MYKFSPLLFAATISLITGVAHADTMVLRNGDQISGNVMLMKDPKAIRFHTSFNQTVKVPWNQINAVYDQNGQAIALPNFAVQAAPTNAPPLARIKKPIPAAPATTTVPSVTASTTAAAPTTEEAAAANTDELFWGAKWSGRANLGASLQTGNSEKDAINADAELKAKWGDKHRGKILAEYNRENDDGQVTEDNKFLQGTYDYFFDEKWFTNSVLSVRQDKIDMVDLRTTLGIGLGYQAYERDDLNLQFVAGPTYLRTKYEDGDKEDSLALRWAMDYDQKLWEDAIQIFHKHELLAPSDDTNAFLFDSSTGLRVPLKKGLIATAQIDFDWDNDPETGIKEDDTLYGLKLGYEW